MILLSKDALGKFYLPVYGNRYWKTPNIDDLAAKGTVFHRHYTAAPSSAMSYYSMFTGQFAMESKMSTFKVVSPDKRFDGETLFDKANFLGFECHVVWDAAWDTAAKLYSECYGKETIFHSLQGIRQPTGIHAISDDKILRDDTLAEKTCEKIEECIRSICESERDIFIWMHLPHCILGRTGYGTDIDLFDRIVGIIRRYISDDSIYITSDHGNMNGSHGKLGYGFDVNEEAITIPLITPRIDELSEVNAPTSSVDLYPLIFRHEVKMREFIYSDSAYYAQLHRKLAIIHGDYKYIFNKRGKKEELYDVVYDPHETQNLIVDRMIDPDRGLRVSIEEMYFYPRWEELDRERDVLRGELKRIWRSPTFKQHLRALYEKNGKLVKRKYIRTKKKLKIWFELRSRREE
jgi:hypothetical protein